MNAFEQTFEEQFSDMAEEAKPLSLRELQDHKEFVRGEEDCLRGRTHKENQCEAYNQGYKSRGEK